VRSGVGEEEQRKYFISLAEARGKGTYVLVSVLSNHIISLMCLIFWKIKARTQFSCRLVGCILEKRTRTQLPYVVI
jgi:hypothetical protein